MRRWPVVMMLLALLASLPALAATTGSFERTLKVSGPVQLDVKTGSGDITIRKGDNGSVRVYGRIRAGNGWFSGDTDERVRNIEQNPPIEQTGNTIRIGHTGDSEWFRNISITYEIVVPEDSQVMAQAGSGNVSVERVKGPARLHTGSGNISAAEIGADVDAQSGSGNIDLTSIKGNANTHAGSGRIHIERVASVEAQTGSGGIRVVDMQGRLRAHAGSGNIEVEGTPTGDWNVQTGSGTVSLRPTGNNGFDFEAHTGSGDIETDQPMTISGRQSRHEMSGKVRGGGPLIYVHTGSGSIHIRS